ncbi:MAG: biotin synthase BioB [Terrimicrobiaceae bacterium]
MFPDDPFSACLKLSGEAQAGFHRRAAEERDGLFGNRVFVRGVVEISNFCRENCGYCAMRRDHRDQHRYRLSAEEIAEEVIPNIPDFVTDLNIQAGEDPVAVREIAIPLIRELKASTTLGISVCLGTLPDRDYAALQEAGADYYVIKVETGNAGHYRSVESPGSLEERVAAIRHLAASGWNVSSGFVLGLPGQTDAILDETVALLESLPLAGCSVSPFIPGENTRFSDHPASGLAAVLNVVAGLRLRMPTCIIPAVSAMSLAGEGGYAGALRAGANLATINLTPDRARADYQIYRKDRHIMTAGRVLAEIEAAGCLPSAASMRDWLLRNGSEIATDSCPN